MDQGIVAAQLSKLEQKVVSSLMPADLRDEVHAAVVRLRSVQNSAGFLTEFDTVEKYADWVCNLPWNKVSDDTLDLALAKQVLDKSHYGLTDVKDKILEFLSVLILRSKRGGMYEISRAPIISLVGLVGTGKTTIAYSIAEALGRRIERIPFGGLGGPAMIRGQSKAYPDSEPGMIIRALRRAGTRNPVILLDEIDRVSEHARSDIMGALVELLDPEQNKAFIDHFIDYPFDLSNVLFIATSNNTKDISTAVLDRLEIIQMPSYSDDEKLMIAKGYMFPKIMRESGLSDKDLLVADEVWSFLIRPLGYDPGIRSLQRTVQGMVRKITRNIVEGKVASGQPFVIDHNNMKEYLPQW